MINKKVIIWHINIMNMVTSYAKYSQAAPIATIQRHERNVQYINPKQ